ncbi:MAG: hypothetical protein HZB71_05500 [Betaproteobacteria bacterium]|nr:hypothetical protein [Betaproteobacteria bacterium]
MSDVPRKQVRNLHVEILAALAGHTSSNPLKDIDLVEVVGISIRMPEMMNALLDLYQHGALGTRSEWEPPAFPYRIYWHTGVFYPGASMVVQSGLGDRP